MNDFTSIYISEIQAYYLGLGDVEKILYSLAAVGYLLALCIHISHVFFSGISTSSFLLLSLIEAVGC